MTATDCMGGKRGEYTGISDRTPDVLINHLRDLDLPTILVRMAINRNPSLTGVLPTDLLIIKV